MASYLFPIVGVTLLVLALSPVSSVSSTVLDIDGEPVLNGGNYYILPQELGTGGLTMTGGNTTSPCPLFITQQIYTRGLPLLMLSLLDIKYLTTSIPVEFYFDRVLTSCNKELRWWVAKEDEHGNKYVIVGADGEFKPTYAFKIQEDETGNTRNNVYNIKFCHTIKSKLYSFSEMKCNDVTFVDGLLAVVPNSPYPFSFMKAAVPRLASYV